MVDNPVILKTRVEKSGRILIWVMFRVWGSHSRWSFATLARTLHNVSDHSPHGSKTLNKFPKNYFQSKENQKEFLEKIKEKYQIKTEEDWSRIGNKIIIQEGGRSLLRNKKSFTAILEANYPESSLHDFNKYPKNYWSSIDHQKEFFKEKERELNFSSKKEWNKISKNEFNKLGGRKILNNYKNYIDMLETIYPDENWTITEFPTYPKLYFEDNENLMSLFKQVENDFKINNPKDWLSITPTEFATSKNSKLLLKQFSNLFEIVSHFYPEEDWHEMIYEYIIEKNTIPLNYFKKNLNNQKTFFQKLGERELNIKELDDWYSITVSEIKAFYGGEILLNKHLSFFRILLNLFPEKHWDYSFYSKYPKNYWQNKENHRKFFDKIKEKYEIKNEEDWCKVNYSIVVKEGGARLLRYYQNIFHAISSIYPEVNLDIFNSRSRLPNQFWNDFENVKSFVFHLKKIFKIETKSDWSRLSYEQIQQNGGSSLINKYGNLCNVLRKVYPEDEWDFDEFSRRDKRSSQRWLFLQLRSLFPLDEIVEEYLLEELSRVSGNKIQVDIYIPAKRLAFEYHGQHHFEENIAFGPLELFQQRDAEKIQLCKQFNIQLIVIPYSWNSKLNSLKQLIVQTAPCYVEYFDSQELKKQ